MRKDYWFIELDDDLPRVVCGKYAIHCDSEVIMESENLGLLEFICTYHNTKVLEP